MFPLVSSRDTENQDFFFFIRKQLYQKKTKICKTSAIKKKKKKSVQFSIQKTTSLAYLTINYTD